MGRVSSLSMSDFYIILTSFSQLLFTAHTILTAFPVH